MNLKQRQDVFTIYGFDDFYDFQKKSNTIIDDLCFTVITTYTKITTIKEESKLIDIYDEFYNHIYKIILKDKKKKTSEDFLKCLFITFLTEQSKITIYHLLKNIYNLEKLKTDIDLVEILYKYLFTDNVECLNKLSFYELFFNIITDTIFNYIKISTILYKKDVSKTDCKTEKGDLSLQEIYSIVNMQSPSKYYN